MWFFLLSFSVLNLVVPLNWFINLVCIGIPGLGREFHGWVYVFYILSLFRD